MSDENEKETAPAGEVAESEAAAVTAEAAVSEAPAEAAGPEAAVAEAVAETASAVEAATEAVAPEAKAAKAKAPKAKAETAKAETAKAKTAKAKTAKAETAKAETPKAKAPKAKTPKAEAPEADASDAVAAESTAPDAAAPDAAASEAAAPEAAAAEASAAAPAAEASKPKRANKKRGRPRKSIEEVEVGFRTKGKVVGLAKFGAFVDIGATTDGLVHISEFPGKRINKVEDAVSAGDEVEVWVKEIDASKNRISLSMKAKPANPLADLSAGLVLNGTVSSVTKYGVFVDIGSETEGLVHISEMSSGYVQAPEEIVKPGQTVEVRIKEVDAQRERISLSMVGLANDDAPSQESKGGGKSKSRKEEYEDYSMPDEPEVRMPTVLELALRGAGLLAPEEDEAGDTAAEETAEEIAARSNKRDLTDVYSRMISDYRETKAAEER